MEKWQHLTIFLRIIMPSVIRERRLVLPEKFVEIYGDELSETIKLSLPVGGAGWYVGLKQCGALLYLCVGWEKFMKHYSIRFGYLLSFNYKGNSEFGVHVFDLTATEILYPLGCSPDLSNHKSKQADVRAAEEEDDTEILTPWKKRKVIRTGTNARLPSKRVLVEKTVLDQELKRGLVAAEMYKTENPFFIVNMKAYNRLKVWLPRKFSKEHMNGCLKFIELIDSDNHKWLVRLNKNALDDDRMNLGKGWGQFVMEKGLKIDDVCVFELITVAFMKVSVFHAKR